MHHWAARTLRREVPEREEDRILAALLAGGDSRLSLDALGLNKYLCPPLPPPATTCLSSCTASPISEAGFERASAAFWRIAAAPKILESSRIQDREDAIGAAIGDYLGLDSGDQVFLTASGTDGMLLAACLLALEGRDRPMTVIMPSPSETGSGVPLAAACRVFDGPNAGVSLVEAFVTSDHIVLRGPDGTPREAGAVAEDFGDSIRLVRGRPVVVFTYGTKTGLVAPVEIPAGINVIVDACQLRLPASKIREFLKMGWPVVITGSKFLGGPAFCGAVLVPSAHFSKRLRTRAGKVCALAGGLAGLGVTGPLLRWSAALATLEGLVMSQEHVEEGVKRLEREAAAVVAALPGSWIIEQPTGCPGIVTFAVEAARRPGSWLSANDLRLLYYGLAARGILVGQPVDLGPFGGLRVAIGMRDVVRGSIEESLRRLAEAWPLARRQGAARAKAA